MNRTTKQLASIGFAFLLVASLFSVVQVGSAQAAPDQYSITQGEQCTTVTPIQKQDDVQTFYDYRQPYQNGELPESGSTEPGYYDSHNYSSYGTDEYQTNQQSKLFLYEDGNGTVSLVFLHDKLDVDNEDAPYGGTISMDIVHSFGGSWAVEDDDYPQEDDDWNKTGASTQVNWVWGPHRTDGGAYTGLQNIGSGAMTIDPGFNRDADRDGSWEFSGGNNDINDWRFIQSDGSEFSLEMDSQVTITAGACPDDDTDDGTDSPDNGTDAPDNGTDAPDNGTDAPDNGTDAPDNGTDVPDDGNETTTPGDGNETTTPDDGNETTTPENTTTPDEPTTTPDDGNQTTTPDDGDKTTTPDDGNETTTPGDGNETTTPDDGDEPPTADLTWDWEQKQYNQVELDASGSADDNGIVKYVWDYGDGSEKVVTTPDDEVFERKFPKYHASGNYTATVTVYDESGQSDSANVTFTVDDETAPTLELENIHVPEKVAAGQEFTSKLDATYDPTGVTVDWTFEGEAPSGGQDQEAQDWNGNEQRSWAKHTFENASEDKKKVTVTVTDGEGNTASQDLWVKVEPEDWTPPKNDDGNDADDGSNDADGNDADDGDSNDGDHADDGHDAKSDDDDDSWVDVHRKAYERKQAREEAKQKAEEQKNEKEQNETATPEPTFDGTLVDVVDFDLSDESIEAGQQITATAKVMNGNEVNGTTTVRLLSDGTEIATKDVPLDAGETKTVTMSHTFDSAGTYTLKAGGMSQSLTVDAPTTNETTDDEKALQDGTPTMQQEETTNDSGQPGFGIVAALIALVAAALIAVRRD